jgi:uncharacterized membrane protein
LLGCLLCWIVREPLRFIIDAGVRASKAREIINKRHASGDIPHSGNPA